MLFYFDKNVNNLKIKKAIKIEIQINMLFKIIKTKNTLIKYKYK